MTSPEHVKRACGIFDWKENSSWCVLSAVRACSATLLTSPHESQRGNRARVREGRPLRAAGRAEGRREDQRGDAADGRVGHRRRARVLARQRRGPALCGGPARASAFCSPCARAARAALTALARPQVAADAAAGVAKCLLSPAQAAGLRHYEDLKTRIPRAEVLRSAWLAASATSVTADATRVALQVKAIYELVRSIAQKLTPGCTAEPVGSYRRGAADSGACCVPAVRFIAGHVG